MEIRGSALWVLAEGHLGFRFEGIGEGLAFPGSLGSLDCRSLAFLSMQESQWVSCSASARMPLPNQLVSSGHLAKPQVWLRGGGGRDHPAPHPLRPLLDPAEPRPSPPNPGPPLGAWGGASPPLRPSAQAFSLGSGSVCESRWCCFRK